jgi:hypothetical protein
MARDKFSLVDSGAEGGGALDEEDKGLGRGLDKGKGLGVASMP